MAKLVGKKKAEFLARMAKGRRKAARGNPARKPKAGTRKKNATKAKGKLVGKKKAEFLARMAKGRRKAGRAGTSQKAAPRKKAINGRAKRRHNSIAEAAQMFETFHQKAPGRVLEYDETSHYRQDFAEMGELRELRFMLDASNRNFPLTQFKGTQAVCTPDGTNIYFIGGDQQIDFDSLGIGSDKDMVELGPCNYIEYKTVKGFHDFEPTRYHHEFGEEDGILPVLNYDRLNKALFLVGGNYRVRREGIVN